ncbi:MAG: hypothetical protein QOG46_2567 [Pseudonocardiales bacterium]|jgi:cysteinyl-tRNA synthetase|nr:hypothetical protein [Pseudonocardiales bacterium]
MASCEGKPAIGVPARCASARARRLNRRRAHRDSRALDIDSGLKGRDVNAAVTAVLELEQAIVDWSADTEEMDGTEAPRAMLRRMVTRLAELAVLGARDPRETVAPLVEALIELREQAREQGSWTLADSLRDRLTAAGIEVRDTPTGPIWLLTDRPGPLNAG